MIISVTVIVIVGILVCCCVAAIVRRSRLKKKMRYKMRSKHTKRGSGLPRMPRSSEYEGPMLMSYSDPSSNEDDPFPPALLPTPAPASASLALAAPTEEALAASPERSRPTRATNRIGLANLLNLCNCNKVHLRVILDDIKTLTGGRVVWMHTHTANGDSVHTSKAPGVIIYLLKTRTNISFEEHPDIAACIGDDASHVTLTRGLVKIRITQSTIDLIRRLLRVVCTQ